MSMVYDGHHFDEPNIISSLKKFTPKKEVI
jgi:hypothetical protein